MNRRQFIYGAIASAGGIYLSSCAATGPLNPPGTVDAGKLSDYSRDGEVDRFARSNGFMLSTFGGKLVAVSSVCTYRDCIVEAAGDGNGFVCPCHGCRFDRWGSVRKGPAHNPLVHFVMSVDSRGHVMVDTDKPLIQPMWNRIDSYLSVKG